MVFKSGFLLFGTGLLGGGLLRRLSLNVERRIVLSLLKVTCFSKRLPVLLPKNVLRLVAASINGTPRGSTEAKLFTYVCQTNETVSTRIGTLGVTNKAIANGPVLGSATGRR
jgi:hypothetical protein